MSVSWSETETAYSPPRRSRWRVPFALKLLLLSIFIPVAGTLLWHYYEPLMADYHIFRMKRAYRNKDYDGALVELSGLLRLSPTASAAALSVTTTWPKAPREHLAEILASVLEGQRPFDPKNPLLALPYQIAPESSQTLMFTVRTAADDQGDYRRAAKILSAAIAKRKRNNSDGDFSEYEMLAKVSEETEDFLTALRCYKMLIRMHPRDISLPLRSMYILSRMGRYEDALRQCCTTIAKTLNTRTMSYGYRLSLLSERAKLFSLLRYHKKALLDLRAARWMNRTSLVASRWSASSMNEILNNVLLQVYANMGRKGEVFRAVMAKSEVESRTQERVDAFISVGKYPEAIAEYRRGILEEDGSSITLYNNLAWLLATARDRHYREPAEALRLAQIAVKLDKYKNSNYLDTLAEAYYVNGQYAEAVKWESLALQKGGEQYRKSLERFTHAAAEAAAGKTVVVKDSSLLEHGKLQPSEKPLTLDFATLASGPRFSSRTYTSVLGGGQRRRSRRRWAGNPDAMLAYLAKFWLACPVTAVEDPQTDLREMIITLTRQSSLLDYSYGSSSYSSKGKSLPSGFISRRQMLSFLFTLASHLHEEEKDSTSKTAAATKPSESKSQAIAPEIYFGKCVGLLLRSFSPPQMHNFFANLARSRYRLSECLLRPEGLAKNASLKNRWEAIARRLRLIASGKEFTPRALPARYPMRKSPRVRRNPSRRYRSRRLTPPPMP